MEHHEAILAVIADMRAYQDAQKEQILALHMKVKEMESKLSVAEYELREQRVNLMADTQ